MEFTTKLLIVLGAVTIISYYKELLRVLVCVGRVLVYVCKGIKNFYTPPFEEGSLGEVMINSLKWGITILIIIFTINVIAKRPPNPSTEKGVVECKEVKLQVNPTPKINYYNELHLNDF